MNIQRLTIKNFRSIGADELDITFDNNLTVLIGKNNVGKSNIIKALDIVIGGYWPREDIFKLEDFHKKNIENDIEICVYFREPLEHVSKIENWYEYKVKVYGFKLEYKTYKRATEEAVAGELHLDYYCINNKGEIIRMPTKAPGKGPKHKEFQSSFTNILRVSRQLRNQVQSVLIPVERGVLKFSPSNSRTLLVILMKKVRAKFLESKETINIDEMLAKKLGIETEITRKELFEGYIKKANETLKTDDLNKISETIEKYLIEHIGQHQAEDINFDFQVQGSWNQYKYIELALKHNDITLPADRLGQGFQSLIVLAIFRSYQEIKDESAIFLIEEPEMFLHTHAKKFFYSILLSMASSGTQIILSTHAAEFVDLLNYKNAKRIVLKNSTTTAYPTEQIELDFSEDELLKLNTAINNERAEIFFAERVILVEGETEKVVYDYLLKLKGVDPNLHNISIIETSGKGSMYRYIKLLQNLNIPFVIVHDSDILTLTGDKDDKINENNADARAKNEKIEESIELKDRLFVFNPYFEVTANITSRVDRKNDSKPLTAIAYFKGLGNYNNIKSTLKEIAEPIETLLE